MRHYTADERLRLVSDWRSSGMSRKSFAKKSGVSSASLTAWIKRLEPNASHAAFRPVVITELQTPTNHDASPVAEVADGALKIRIFTGISNETLATILRAMRESKC